jgi:hypothetical protein
MESSGQERPMESRGREARMGGVVGNENMGLVNFVHVMVAILIVGLLVAYIIIDV